jgi:hypothetical protein
MAEAQRIAKAHWGAEACNSRVVLSWSEELADGVAAEAAWSNPTSSYDHPERNANCAIRFNADVTFDWPKFCTIAVHEYGHLNGQRHDEEAGHVMGASYRQPLPACQATPDSSAGSGGATGSGAEGPSLRARGDIKVSAS